MPSPFVSECMPLPVLSLGLVCFAAAAGILWQLMPVLESVKSHVVFMHHIVSYCAILHDIVSYHFPLGPYRANTRLKSMIFLWISTNLVLSVKISKLYRTFQYRFCSLLCATFQHIVIDGVTYFLLTQQLAIKHCRLHQESILSVYIHTTYITQHTQCGNSSGLSYGLCTDVCVLLPLAT